MEPSISQNYAGISRRTFISTAAISLPVLFGIQGTAAADEPSAESVVRADWPTFLGPTRNNISQETGLLREWPEEGPPQLWQRTVGDGYGPPVVSQERLVVFHRRENEE
ncbi:MAG: hypothetical protein L3K26_04840, partial [Candidatus Hydrogenedentes bacterium]|nr:hypothetical protein [Candidatus Hydrogenedentota bacterium]